MLMGISLAEFVSINIVLCLSLVLLLWIRKRRRLFSVFSDHGIRGPKPNFWTGNFNEFLQKRERCLPEYREKYGDIFGCFIGAKPFLVVLDKELLKIIQIKAFKSFSNREVMLPDAGVPHSDVLGAITVERDEEWKVLRSIVSPTFSTGKLKKIVPLVNDAINVFLEIISEKSRREEVFDIFSVFKNLTLDVSSKAELGIKTGAQSGETNLFLKSAELLLNTDAANRLAALSICFPELEPIPTKLRLLCDKINYTLGRKSIKLLISVVKEVIRQRRECNEKREDILQSLIDGKIDAAKLSSIRACDLASSSDMQQEDAQESYDTEKKDYVTLSERSIRANALLFFVVGFDTTSSTMSLVTYYLAKYQDIQERARNEINSIIKKGDSVQYSDVAKLHYLDQVISETLRLHSLTMIATSRIAKEAFKYKGLTIPKGVAVSIPTHLLHRDPDHWPDPENFNPERFSPENKAKIDPMMYQPFGSGPRNCVGQRFAHLVMKLTLARLLQRYKLEAVNDEAPVIEFSLFVLHPKEILVKATPI